MLIYDDNISDSINNRMQIWIVHNFIFFQLYLFLYYISCCTVAVFLVIIASWKTAQDSTETQPEVSTITRKYFHILALFIFLPGLYFDPSMMCFAATCAIFALAFLEVRFGWSVPNYFVFNMSGDPSSCHQCSWILPTLGLRIFLFFLKEDLSKENQQNSHIT